MLLDIPTMLVTLLAASVLVGVMLPFARGLGGGSGLLEATLGAWSLALSAAALLFRGRVPDPVSIIGGNGFLWLGVALQIMAYRRFDRPHRRSRWPLVATGAAIAAFAAAWALGAGYVARAVFSTAVIGALLALSVRELVRDGGLARERSRRIAVVILVAAAAMMGVRAALLLDGAPVEPSLLGPSLERSIGFFPTFIYVFGVGLGFLTMHVERAEGQARTLALTDPLTGCANRRALEERFRAELDHAHRKGRPLSLILADLDRFKRVNDEHGHDAGDAVIRHFAETLRAQARSSDVVARLGGEEFCVLVREAGVEGAAELAERVRTALAARPVYVAGATLPVTASFGVTALDREADRSWETLYRRADAALYRAKEGGRDRVERG